MTAKVLPELDFDDSPESIESDLKMFVGVAGASEAFTYAKPASPTLANSIDACRTALTTAGFKEFGALKSDIKFDRKEGKTKTNYKSSMANEGTFTLVNCTVKNYKMADAVNGDRLDIVVIDEANGTAKIRPKLKIAVTEKDENEKAEEISFKATNDTCSPNSRIVINLLTGDATNKP